MVELINNTRLIQWSLYTGTKLLIYLTYVSIPIEFFSITAIL